MFNAFGYSLNRTMTYFSFLNRFKSSSSVTTSKDADSTLCIEINSNDIITIKFIFITRRMVHNISCHSKHKVQLAQCCQENKSHDCYPLKLTIKKQGCKPYFLGIINSAKHSQPYAPAII